MRQSTDDVPSEDQFGLWYRVKSLIILDLLSFAGPAQLDTHNDPRTAVQRDYERRRDLHRQRLGKPPVVPKPPAQKGGLDVVVLCAAAGVLALVVLIVWAVASAL